MSIFTRTNFVRRSFMLAAICGASAAVMGAQTGQPAATTQGQAVSAPAVDFKSYAATSLLATSPVGEDVSSNSSSSSSSADDVATVSADPLHLNAMQYNGRRRYGRPRYRGGNTNADGSNKWIFYGGAGLSQPAGNTWKYLTPSWGLQVGGGRQFSKHFALPIEFDYDHFGFTKQTLDNQVTVYDALFGAGSVDGLLDGSSHIWSFSVDPTYTFYSGDSWGAYVVGSVGFYHKTATFTIPGEEEYCDFYGFCYQYEANEPIDQYTSNAPGFGAGIGATYKFSHFANERFYAEARYVFVDNAQRQGITVNNLSAITDTTTNFYPANSNKSTYFPIKFGIRF